MDVVSIQMVFENMRLAGMRGDLLRDGERGQSH